jgi:HTH-type transcriptional regulator/antitoxin HigA
MPTLNVSAVRAIRTRAEYAAALKEAERLIELDPAPRTDAGAWLEGLAVLIEAYEAAQFPAEETSPRDIIDFVLEQRDMTRADLADYMGGKSRVSEFFAGKRDLSLSQIAALSEVLRIPADLLLPRTRTL